MCIRDRYYISEYGPDDRELLTEVVGGTLQKDYMDYRQTVHANELEWDCLTSFRQFFFIKKNKAFLLKISLKAFSVSD